MDRLTVSNVAFSGQIGKRERLSETLRPFSHEFSFGKVYFVDVLLGHGGWTLSWIIGGRLRQSSGVIELNGTRCTQSILKNIAWCVRRSEIRGFLASPLTVREQIVRGLRRNTQPGLTEDQVVQFFKLTPERYRRPLKQLSHEAWRASCAIGLAQGKKIFCFPYIDYVRPDLIEEYADLWFRDVLETLKSYQALVIIPSVGSEIAYRLSDEVIKIRQ